MSETSGRIMNTAEEEREEHQPEDYYNVSIYLFLCVCVCESVCVFVNKTDAGWEHVRVLWHSSSLLSAGHISDLTAL